jgi:hypothetical protein
VEAAPRKLLRSLLTNGGVVHGPPAVVASGLQTQITGITRISNLNFTSDVLLRANGDIVVSGTVEASLIALHPSP